MKMLMRGAHLHIFLCWNVINYYVLWWWMQLSMTGPPCLISYQKILRSKNGLGSQTLLFNYTSFTLSFSRAVTAVDPPSPFKSQQSNFTLPLINCPLLPFSLSTLSSSYFSHPLASLFTTLLLSPLVMIIPAPFITSVCSTTSCLSVPTVIGRQRSQSKEFGFGFERPKSVFMFCYLAAFSCTWSQVFKSSFAHWLPPPKHFSVITSFLALKPHHIMNP